MSEVFDISKYNTPSYSFLKGLEQGAPNRIIYDRQNPTEQKGYQFEGKVIENAVLRPNEFEKIYKVDNSGINTDTKGYKFAKAYWSCVNEKDLPTNEAIEIAKIAADLSTKESTLLDKLKKGGEYERLVNHVVEFSGVTKISNELHTCAIGHQKRVWKEKNWLYDFLIDENCEIEPELFWLNSNTELECRGFPDVSIKNEVKIDLKTSRNISPASFARNWGDIHKFDYIPQLSAYTEADMSRNQQAFIYAMEKKPPFNILVYKISDYDLEIGYEKFTKWCAAFKFIRDNNLWDLGYEFETMYHYDQNECRYYKKNSVPIFETQVFL